MGTEDVGNGVEDLVAKQDVGSGPVSCSLWGFELNPSLCLSSLSFLPMARRWAAMDDEKRGASGAEVEAQRGPSEGRWGER